MADREYYRTQLYSLLRAEYDCAGRLNCLLGAETQALAARNVDAIEPLIEEKQDLLRQFEALAQRMQALLHDAGFSGDRPDIEGCLSWCDEQGELLRGWQLILDRIREAQHRNRVNGVTLEAARRHAQQAVALLRGQTPQLDLYNPAGATASNVAGSRTLAKA